MSEILDEIVRIRLLNGHSAKSIINWKCGITIEAVKVCRYRGGCELIGEKEVNLAEDEILMIEYPRSYKRAKKSLDERKCEKVKS